MIYELAHFIKNKCCFLWDAVELGNAYVFSILHKKTLQEVPRLLESISNDVYTIRVANDSDAESLVRFFAAQPDDAFVFFKPHDFDISSMQKILRNQAFQTFVVTEQGNVVGYFFLRSFINRKCFRGKIVDKSHQGRGIAKLMGVAMSRVAQLHNLRMYGSISPENYASIASAKASNDIKVHKVLDNGYYYIEFLPKKIE